VDRYYIDINENTGIWDSAGHGRYWPAVIKFWRDSSIAKLSLGQDERYVPDLYVLLVGAPLE